MNVAMLQSLKSGTVGRSARLFLVGALDLDGEESAAVITGTLHGGSEQSFRRL
jgi:hypothetical protein